MVRYMETIGIILSWAVIYIVGYFVGRITYAKEIEPHIDLAIKEINRLLNKD